MQDMKTIKAQLHLVATEEKSGIFRKTHDIRGNRINDSKLKYTANQTYIDSMYLMNSGNAATNSKSKVQFYNFYFTSDEEIKEGDWYLYNNKVFRLKFGDKLGEGARKIVASIDSKLLADTGSFEPDGTATMIRLPQPTKQAVEAYCKKPFDECLIEVEECRPFGKVNLREKVMGDNGEYFKAFNIKVNSYNEITCHPVVEKMYSEKELIGAMEYAFMIAKDMDDCEYYRKKLM